MYGPQGGQAPTHQHLSSSATEHSISATSALLIDWGASSKELLWCVDHIASILIGKFTSAQLHPFKQLRLYYSMFYLKPSVDFPWFSPQEEGPCSQIELFDTIQFLSLFEISVVPHGFELWKKCSSPKQYFRNL